MRTPLLKFITLGFLVSFSCASAQISDNRVMEPAAMKQDFNYLRKALEDTHPGLYMHHSEEEMRYKMDSIYQLLNKPLPFFEFYRHIAYLIAEIKCEHTYCTPYGSNLNKNILQWNLLPVQLYFLKSKAYVVVNRTMDTAIHLGDEVIAINHHPIDSIHHELLKYIPADGFMEASKDHFLSSMNFALYYYQFIERPDAFTITFKNAGGQLFDKHFSTDLTFQKSNENALKNSSNRYILEYDQRSKKRAADPWRLEFMDDQKTAILTLRTFGGNREKLFAKYDSFFTAIQHKNISNLLIDISFNDGGDEEYAMEVLSYLILKPTRFIEEEYLITGNDSYFKQTNLPKDALKNKSAFLKPMKDGKIMAKEQTEYTRELKVFFPKPNRFNGSVYFYVNGGTSSAASTCAAAVQSNKLGTIVGEETAGCFAGGGTTNGLNLTLPNSKIATHTSIVYQRFATSGKDKDRGVIPDFYFIPTFENLLSANDSWKEFIFNLINAKAGSL